VKRAAGPSRHPVAILAYDPHFRSYELTHYAAAQGHRSTKKIVDREMLPKMVAAFAGRSQISDGGNKCRRSRQGIPNAGVSGYNEFGGKPRFPLINATLRRQS
jgi:hypothetical protein